MEQSQKDVNLLNLRRKQLAQQSRLETEGEIKIYKKKLLKIVIGIFLLSMAIILERIFFQTIINLETTLLEKVQKGLKLVTENEQFATFKNNFFFEIIGTSTIFQIQMMWITSIFIAIYYGFNTIIGIKVVYCTLFLMYIITVLQMIYKGPQPAWVSSFISAPVCLEQFNLPSIDLFSILFIVFYTNYCYEKRSKNLNKKLSKFKNILLIITSIVLISYFTIRYLIGLNFIIDLFSSFIYFFLFYQICKVMNTNIDSVIRKSAISLIDSKKYVFQWFFYLLIFQIFAAILNSGSDKFNNINWIQNYIFCSFSKNQLNVGASYITLIGNYYNFAQTSVLSALQAAIFAIAFSFRNLKDTYWFEGTLKQRILRIIVAYLSMAPSWVLVYFQDKIIEFQFSELSGMTQFIFNTIHFFILYLWLFGFMPVFLFKALKLNGLPKQEDKEKFENLTASFVSQESNPNKMGEQPFLTNN